MHTRQHRAQQRPKLMYKRSEAKRLITSSHPLRSLTAGSKVLLLATQLLLLAIAANGARVKEVYIGAELDSAWDYTNGAGKDSCIDPSPVLNPRQEQWQQFLHPQASRLPRAKFTKARFHEYTAGWEAKKPVAKHLGILGALLYVEAGTTLIVHLKNSLPFDVNMEVKQAQWEPAGNVASVRPYEIATFTWKIPEDTVTVLRHIDEGDWEAAWEAGEQTSKLFMIHSSVNPIAHDSMGLLAPLIVTAKGFANADGTAMGIQRDIVTMFQVTEESATTELLPANAQPAAQLWDDKDDSRTFAINGYVYCNLPDLTAAIGERVRWHVVSVGFHENVHNFHWHGITFLHAGHRVDHINLVGWSSASLDATPDTPGDWLFHCHVNKHLDSGMIAIWHAVDGPVPPLVPLQRYNGAVREYFIQAEEVEWNYAPKNGECCSGKCTPFGEAAAVFLGEPEGYKIGSVYTKAQYVGYTCGKFDDPVACPSIPRKGTEDEYLGILGPTIRCNVGDLVKVTFRNTLKYQVSIHPHGVLYNKDGEGAPYKDGTTTKGDDFVNPGSTYVYQWVCAERSGPGPTDGSSLVWLYHSHSDETTDTNLGLMGAIVVNRAGVPTRPVSKDPRFQGLTSNQVGLPLDVDKEAILVFTVMDEAMSTYALDNVKQRLPYYKGLTKPSKKDVHQLFASDEFQEASKHHMINGFMYCNNPRMAWRALDKVRFHIHAYGSDVDVHTPSIQGGMFEALGIHRSSFATVGGGMTTMDVQFTEPGKNHNVMCRVHDHVNAGMIARYDIIPTQSGPRTGRKPRVYNIAADEVEWDYTNGKGAATKCTNMDLSKFAEPYVAATENSLGPLRTKAVFREYEVDAYGAWHLKDRRGTEEEYLGSLGPIIYAEVGDTIVVNLKNNLGNLDVRFAPDGGLVTPRGWDNSKVARAGCPEVVTYKFVVPKQAGPVKGDLNTVAVPYFSNAADLPTSINSGLVGVMVIGGKEAFKRDKKTPKGVDKLVVLNLQVTDESASIYYSANKDAELEHNDMHHINGYIYCSMPPISVTAGSKVRVVALALGSEEGAHSPHLVGQTMVSLPGQLEFQMMLPTVTAQMDYQVTRSTGLWPILDDVLDHQQAGMMAQLSVVPKHKHHTGGKAGQSGTPPPSYGY